MVGWPIQDSGGTLTLAERSATEEAVRATKSPQNGSSGAFPPLLWMRVSPCRSALSALASTAQAARSQWGNGKAVRAQTPQALLLNSLGLGETQ